MTQQQRRRRPPAQLRRRPAALAPPGLPDELWVRILKSLVRAGGGSGFEPLCVALGSRWLLNTVLSLREPSQAGSKLCVECLCRVAEADERRKQSLAQALARSAPRGASLVAAWTPCINVVVGTRLVIEQARGLDGLFGRESFKLLLSEEEARSGPLLSLTFGSVNLRWLSAIAAAAPHVRELTLDGNLVATQAVRALARLRARWML